MRDITQLHPALQEKLTQLKSECEKQGLKIGISECVRTVEEQNALYAKGRTTSGSKVTNAKGTTYSSMHQWGVAFDFCRNDGKGSYVDSDGFFTKVGKIGQSIGLEWGGAWISIKDKPHFQLPNWGSGTSKLKKTYGTPAKFMATWNKSTATTTKTNPYIEPNTTLRKGNNNGLVKWLQWELVQSGFKLTIDGDFGTKTETAVKQFQKLYNLSADGIVGAKTIAMLKSK